MTAGRARTRTRGQTYTARLRQRTAPPPRKPPGWLRQRWPLALLTVTAEVGHLAAAVAEWPGSPPRGVFHVLAAAVQGLAAVALYFGLVRPDLGYALAVNGLVAVAWPVGVLAGVSPYQHYPVVATAAVVAVEATTTLLILAHRRALRPSRPDPMIRPARARP